MNRLARTILDDFADLILDHEASDTLIQFQCVKEVKGKTYLVMVTMREQKKEEKNADNPQ